MNHSVWPEEWSTLLHAVAEESLTDEQERRLADLLRSNVAFRHEYILHCQLITLLTWQLTATPGDPASRIEILPETPPLLTGLSRHRSLRSRKLWIAGVLAMIVIGIVWLRPPRSESTSPGDITEIVGEVTVARADGSSIRLRAEELTQQPWMLQPDDQIETERDSWAKLLFRDKTAIHLFPNTRLSLGAEPSLKLTVPEGQVQARVTPQPSGESITFVSPHAEIRVLGTELEILSLAGRTDVAVSEGKVRVTRNSDGQTSEVATAQFLSITDSGDLAVLEWPQPADEWSVDFDAGLPVGWSGRASRDGLPNNSRGAAQSVLVSQERRLSMEIGSPTHPDGLFAWHDDSVLHITFRVQPPGWFHIYLYARPYADSQTSLTYCCVKPDLWQSLPGEWRTVSIPCSEFRRIGSGPTEPMLGRIPNRIVFSGPSDSAGFALDRISVNRTGSTTSANAPQTKSTSAR